MPLGKSYMTATIVERLKGCWEVRITYGAVWYSYVETHITATLEEAKRWLLDQRCPGLRIVDHTGKDV